MSDNKPYDKPKSGINYGELVKFPDLVSACENLSENLREVQDILDQVLPLKKQYDKLTPEEQVELDLFLLFTLNCLHWIHLRIQGIDPTTQPVKGELERIKAVMVRWEQVKASKNRPKVNVEAAKRFVRSGLYDPSLPSVKQNKKRKFDENTEDE